MTGLLTRLGVWLALALLATMASGWRAFAQIPGETWEAKSQIRISADGGSNNLILPGEAFTVIWEPGGTWAPQFGEATLTLPSVLEFGSWLVSDDAGTVKEVTVSGKTMTVAFEWDKDAGVHSGRADIRIGVRAAELEALPDLPATVRIDTHVRVGYEGYETAVTDKSFLGYMLYARVGMGLATEETPHPGDTITYAVTVANYPFGTPLAARLSLFAPTGSDIVPGSLSGSTAGASISESPSVLSLRWDGSAPAGLALSYQVRIRDTEFLSPDQATIEVRGPSYRLRVQTTHLVDWTGQTVRFDRWYETTGETIVTPLDREPPGSEIIVNSLLDRSRSPAAEQAETGHLNATGDPEVTLRSAIEAVNLGLGNRIRFEVPTGGIPALLLSSPLPPLLLPVTLDGTTQPGAKKVELRGGGLVGKGLEIRGGHSEVRGLVINGFAAEGTNGGAAVLISGPGNNVVAGNYLGTDSTGNAAAANAYGVLLDGSPDNTIGGAETGDRNVIFAQSTGVWIGGDHPDRNRVLGNRIGVGVDGAILGRTEFGVYGESGEDCRIGGEGDAGNTIAAVFGVVFTGETPVGSLLVEGNRLGLDGGGTRTAGLTERRAGLLIHPEAAAYANLQILNNQIAGYPTSVALLGTGCAGARVTGNQIGLTFDGSGRLPEGVLPKDLLYGLRLDGAPRVIVRQNRIAGHGYNLLISGGPQFTLDGEEIRLREPNDPLELPSGVSPAGHVVIEENEVGVVGHHRPTDAEQALGVGVYGGALDVAIVNNTIAGHSQCEVRLYNGSGHTVTGNLVGTADGTDHGSKVGIEVRDVEEAIIGNSGSGNVVGQTADAGIKLNGAAKNVRVVDNVLGMNASGTAEWPNGYGIQIAAAGVGVQIADNVVGGSTISGISSLAPSVVIEGNFVGVSRTGVVRPNQEGGILVSGSMASVRRNTVAGNAGAGMRFVEASSALIEDNWVGITSGGDTRPNRTGISASRSTATLKGNTVAGNLEAGIRITDSPLVTLEDNLIGLTRGGLPRPNAMGLLLQNSAAQLVHNTIAHNSSKGIRIEGDRPVSISEGPIFENGNGSGADGIDYEIPPFVPQVAVVVFRSPEDRRHPPIVWLGVLSEGGSGPRTIEVYGSPRDADPQGRRPLLTFPMEAPGATGLRFDGPETVRFDDLRSFAATVTLEGSTSEFSSAGVLHRTFEAPPLLTFLDSEPGKLTIAWAPPELFKLEEASSIDGPWTDAFATVESHEVDGALASVTTFPASPREETFYRLNVDWERVRSP